jgi:Arc/MetJ-type ribon-helix-helix transcriptional regulator
MPMTISLKPETERLVEEEIRNGHFQSIDDLIVKSVHFWREQQHQSRMSNATHRSEAVDRALAFARDRAISLGGVSIHELIHEGHRL